MVKWASANATQCNNLPILKNNRFIVCVRDGTVLFNFAPLVFLLAARQSGQARFALAGSVGCEQREPEKLFEMLAHLLSLPDTLVFDSLGV